MFKERTGGAERGEKSVMAHLITSLNLVAGKFLGSQDRILFAGNGPNAALQVFYSLPINGQDGIHQHVRIASAQIEGGHMLGLELCGLSRLAKTFAAVSTTDNGGGGTVEFVGIETTMDSAALRASDPSLPLTLRHSSPMTGLVYHSDKEILVVGTETGELLIHDLYANKLIASHSIDATGVNRLCLTPSGQVAVVSNTRKSPAKIFDVRSGKVEKVLDAAVVERQVDVLSSPKGLGFVSVAAHPARNQLFCGDGAGAVVAWDLRADQGLHYQPHASAVTDLVVHPDNHDQILSCSLDGTLKRWNTQQYASSSPLRSRRNASEDFSTLLSQPCGLQSLDVDPQSHRLLVTTRVGKALLVDA